MRCWGATGTAAEGSVNLLIAGRSAAGMVQSKAGGHQRNADGVNADVNPSLVRNSEVEVEGKTKEKAPC